MEQYYFDNAATSFPKAPGVAEAMSRYIAEDCVNIGRGSYARAEAAAMDALHVRELLCELFGFGGRAVQAVFTPGATCGLNMILKGFLRPGDHAIVSSLEHNSVMRPLYELAARGVEFSRIPASTSGITDARALLTLIKKNTRLVLVSHASNVCGAIFPLEETAALCRSRGLALAVDAAQTAGHIPIDFDSLGLSALCVPGHKGLRGPEGIGAVIMTEGFSSELTPLITGGTGSASESERQPEYMPDKFESGTINLPGIAGLGSAAAYILSLGVNNIRSRERELTAQMLAGLKSSGARIVGPADAWQQVGVVSLDFPGQDNALVAARLECEFGILTRCGLHCAPDAHKTLKTFPRGTVRLSIGSYTPDGDIDLVCAAVKKLATG